jgi:cytidyltransferase-like protein
LRVFKDINDIPSGMTSVVSTGTFDGVHLGHKTILSEMIEIAGQKNLQSVVITFDPHPRIVLDKDAAELKLLTTLDEKLEIFESLGIDTGDPLFTGVCKNSLRNLCERLSGRQTGGQTHCDGLQSSLRAKTIGQS